MKTIESALAVIRSQGRYLLYHDDDWDCWMLPNLTVDEYSGDADGCLRSLTVDYEMPPWALDVTGALQVESHKPNPQHDGAVRHYIYTLGFYDLTDADYQYGCVHNHYLVDIEDWEYECDFYRVSHCGFELGEHTCTWWTLDEMLADRRMRQVNADIVGTIELMERGLLAPPPMG